MIRKREILDAINNRDMNNPVTAKDLLVYSPLIRLNISEYALGMALLRSVRQGLLKRSGKGGWSDPYRYQLTIKGLRRLLHFIRQERKLRERINEIEEQSKFELVKLILERKRAEKEELFEAIRLLLEDG